MKFLIGYLTLAILTVAIHILVLAGTIWVVVIVLRATGVIQ